MEERTHGQSPGEGPASATEARGRRAGVLGFLLRHPIGVLQALAALLLAVIVFQNVEPTSIQILFWSIGSVPKLVLILVAMLVGAALWELLRRLIFRS